MCLGIFIVVVLVLVRYQPSELSLRVLQTNTYTHFFVQEVTQVILPLHPISFLPFNNTTQNFVRGIFSFDTKTNFFIVVVVVVVVCSLLFVCLIFDCFVSLCLCALMCCVFVITNCTKKL